MQAFDQKLLRELRKSKGYSLEMLARLLAAKTGKKITKAAISHWEMGRNRPSLPFLLALSDLFKIPPENFFLERTNKMFDRKGPVYPITVEQNQENANHHDETR